MGDGEVDEVNTGNEDDKDGYPGQNIRVYRFAGVRELVFGIIIRTEMDLQKGLQPPIDIPRKIVFFSALLQLILCFIQEYTVHFWQDGGDIYIRGQYHKSGEVEIEPVIIRVHLLLEFHGQE